MFIVFFFNTYSINMSSKDFTIKKTRGGGFIENKIEKDFHLKWGIDPKEVTQIILLSESGVSTLEEGGRYEFDYIGVT